MPKNIRDPAILNPAAGAVKYKTEVRGQEALLKTGALQNAIFNSANFSCIATDAKGVIQIFNVGAERMLGYTTAEVLNKITPADLHDPQEVIDRANALSQELGTTIAPGFEALVFKAARGIEDIYEVTKVRKDGSRFPEILSVTALRDAQDGIIGYLLIGTDNTARHQVDAERKQAEEALRQSEERFRAFVTASSDVVYRMSPDWSEMRQLHGRNFIVDTEKPSGTWLQEYIHPDDQPHVMAVINEAIRTKSTFELEHRVRRVDGTLGWTFSRAIPLPDAKGEIVEWFGAASDVTERKRAEEALRQSEARFQTIVENLAEGLVVSDLNGQLLHFNPAALDLLGLASLDECRHLTEFADTFELSGMDGKVWPVDQWPLRRILRGEKLRNLDVRIRRIKTDWQRVFSYGGTLVHDTGGQPMMAVITISDITERKRFEQALQETNVKLAIAKSAAETANLAKSDFLSRMSHELRSPLNVILGFAQLMDSASPSPTASQTKSIAQILQAGWYLLKLINEVLDLAVIESGNVSLSIESVSLSELMSECQSMMEPQAQERGIRMTFPRFDHPVFVTADRTRLMQIVINLVSNAIKYNKEQGAVVVNCTASVPGRIRFSVKDAGAGLPPERLAQLFTPFNRLGQEAGSVAGTGIGLVVSKRLAELMGGALGVESTVGVGSVFWCELISAEAPRVAVQSGESEASVQPAASADASRRTLLYVEDNPANMQLVEELIARFPDMRLVTAVNGTLGIELARATQPQVILMDINLPGISGIQALKILLDDPATAHIPIIALSANAMPRDIAKGLEAGFFRYLTKPIKIRELMDTLNAALEFAEKRLAEVA